MEEEEQSSSVHGNSPEFGAIFMSNNATKKECLRRRLLGLPYSQSRFVEQVKAGMVLFLFEFEKRELHGVFQACSDGAIDIVPHAFSSSGMKFPAQVKFRPLWCCSPLCENEFRDAIQENYFSRYKFKFGLSEHQVRRLLLLFSSKRLKDESPERQLIRSEVASPDGHITSKNRRLVDDVSPISNQVLGERDMNKHHAPVISTMHQADSYYNDDGFRTFKDVEYEASAFLDGCFQDLMGKVGQNMDAGENTTDCKVDDEWNTGIRGDFRSISNDDRFAESDRSERNFYEADGFPQAASVANPSSFQSGVYPRVYSSKHVLETHSYVDDLTTPPSMEMRNSNVSYPLTSENSIVTSTLPCDLSAHGNYYPGSLSLEFNHGHPSLQEYHTRDSFVGNVLGSSKTQSFPSLLDPDVNSDFIPLPYSDQYEGSSRTSFPRHVYRDNLAAEYSNNERREDLSLLEPSVSSEIRNGIGVNEHSSPYGTCPSKIPYLAFPDRYPTLVQDKHDYRVPKRENDAEFDNKRFKECRSFKNDNRGTEDGRFSIYRNLGYDNKESQHQLHVDEVASSSATACRKRSSVFSRLSLPPKAHEQENNTSPGIVGIDMPNSVNDVMEMLHGNRHQWVQTRGKQLVKHRDVAATVRDKKHDTRKDGTTMISKEMDEKPSSFSKENSDQNTEETTFVDFKRRSAVRKSLEDGKVRNRCEIPNNTNASAAQSKKRKLIRPDFGVIESSDKGISSDTPENVTVGITAESLKVSVCHVNENDMLPNVICQTAVESNSIDMGSGSNSEKCRMEVALVNGNEDGKETSRNHGDNGNMGIISNP